MKMYIGVFLALVIVATAAATATTVVMAQSSVGTGVLPLRFLPATDGAGIDNSAILGNWCERAQYQDGNSRVETVGAADKVVLICHEVSETSPHKPDTQQTWEIPLHEGSSTISDGSVTHPKLAADAVETDNIKDGAVTSSKMGFSVVQDTDRAVIRMLPKKKAAFTDIRTQAGQCCYQQGVYTGTRYSDSDASPVAYLSPATDQPRGGAGVSNRTYGGEAIHVKPWTSSNQNVVVGVSVVIWVGNFAGTLAEEGEYVAGAYIPIPARVQDEEDTVFEVPFNFNNRLSGVAHFRWDVEDRELVHDGYFDLNASTTIYVPVGNLYWVHYRGEFGP